MRTIFFLSLTIFLLISKSSCLNQKQMKLRQKNLAKKKVTNFLEQTADNFYGFKFSSFTGIDPPIRLNKNFDVECFSLNGRDCSWEYDNNELYVLTNGPSLKPLTCGTMHQSLYGSTGYDDPEHWCSAGKDFFYNKWHCFDETGIDTGIKLDPDTNNVQCLSNDGADCIWNDQDACKNPSESIQTLTCGVNLKNLYGGNGYSGAGSHWCKTGRNFFLPQDKWTCFGDINEKVYFPVRQNINGDIECFSTDGMKCDLNYGTGYTCTSDLQGKTAVPLTCGQDYQNKYGSIGYDVINHWCYVVQHDFFSTTSNWY